MRKFWESSKSWDSDPPMEGRNVRSREGESQTMGCFTVGRASLSSGPTQCVMVYSACCA